MAGNRETFLWWSEANQARHLVVPAFASKAEIMKDDEGYWLNVWWSCGVIAPLTVQEHIQASKGVS
ncbi:hypothetical protein HL13_gp68 [Dinoroseobacter phage DFL12phi1]|uniref:Uncharacterized protein n=1 Tax=Dinoroseobacter phage DFL12phi1 TaxID=1477404 RepID=A0A023NG15_9CAUD|nr:hypothetical protein HL13_gp68 [Dinoroseobacter phage DFL12phi1]AHX01028.1 hypothetical protein DFL12P1_0068 [Dinoroseobacter phage DFL12phi1]